MVLVVAVRRVTRCVSEIGQSLCPLTKARALILLRTVPWRSYLTLLRSPLLQLLGEPGKKYFAHVW